MMSRFTFLGLILAFCLQTQAFATPTILNCSSPAQNSGTFAVQYVMWDLHTVRVSWYPMLDETPAYSANFKVVRIADNSRSDQEFSRNRIVYAQMVDGTQPYGNYKLAMAIEILNPENRENGEDSLNQVILGKKYSEYSADEGQVFSSIQERVRKDPLVPCSGLVGF
ncbi:MAG: hypothetical protein H7222_17490 [Methylotenera sp.]|nr:hypothetical protein [Oligoflexia bacterium]